MAQKVYMHKMDIDFIDNPLDFGRKYTRFDVVDSTVEDGDNIALCGQNIKVLHTPGHSQGGVCYVCKDVIFCGDTVFRDGYGRCDLRGGRFRCFAQFNKKNFLRYKEIMFCYAVTDQALRLIMKERIMR